MRELTLDEKITIKGLMRPKGWGNLAKLTMGKATYNFYVLFGRPVGFYYLPAGSNWQRRVNPAAVRIDQRWNQYKQSYGEYLKRRDRNK